MVKKKITKKVVGDKTVYHLNNSAGVIAADKQSSKLIDKFLDENHDVFTAPFQITKLVIDESAGQISICMKTKDGKLFRQNFFICDEDEELARAAATNLKKLVKTAMLMDQADKFRFDLLARVVGKFVIASVVRGANGNKTTEKLDPSSYYKAEGFDSTKWEDELIDPEVEAEAVVNE